MMSRQGLKVGFDGLFDRIEGFLAVITFAHAARQGGHIDGIAALDLRFEHHVELARFHGPSVRQYGLVINVFRIIRLRVFAFEVFQEHHADIDRQQYAALISQSH